DAPKSIGHPQQRLAVIERCDPNVDEVRPAGLDSVEADIKRTFADVDACAQVVEAASTGDAHDHARDILKALQQRAALLHESDALRIRSILGEYPVEGGQKQQDVAGVFPNVREERIHSKA